MSLEAMKWVLHDAHVEDHGDFRVLIALAERAHTDGTCAWPSIKWLAERMQRSERTVQRSLARLQKAGVIRPGDQSNIPPGIPANRRPVVYDLAMPGGESLDRPQDDMEAPPTALVRRTTRARISADTRLLVYERDAYTCVECGAHKNLSLDHIHPVSLGGTDDIDNLETRCRPCNSRKGARVA